MTREVNWNDLPTDLLSLIAEKASNAVDYIRFGAVCVSWRSVYFTDNQNKMIPKKAPVLLILPREDNNFVYNLSEHRIYERFNISLPHKTVCRGLDHGWLVMVSENREIQLINPLSRPKDNIIRTIRIPPLPCQGRITSGLSTSYLYKAILSANPSENQSFVIMAIQHLGDCSHETLSFWKNGDHAWTTIEKYVIGYTIYGQADDVIYYKDKFYAFKHHAGIFAYDVSGPSFKVSLIEAKNADGYYEDKKYLVESCGELLLIVRKSSKKPIGIGLPRQKITDKFEVFKLDQIEENWIRVSDLGERIFFISDHCASINLTASDMPGCKPNDICFVISELDMTKKRKKNIYFDDIGVFNLKDGNIGYLYPSPNLGAFFFQPTLQFINSSVKEEPSPQKQERKETSSSKELPSRDSTLVSVSSISKATFGCFKGLRSAMEGNFFKFSILFCIFIVVWLSFSVC